MSWTPMLAVNLGTGNPEEASRWVECFTANTFGSKPLVVPVRLDEVRMKDGDAMLELPPLLFVAVTLRLA